MLDDRTKAYFEAIKVKLGYVGTNYGWDDIQEILNKKTNKSVSAELISIYDGYVNSSDIKIFTYTLNGDTRFCAELSYQTDIDDYCIETHIFNKQPKRDDIITIRELNSLAFDFKYERLTPEFTCWECGNRVHWLDCDGDLSSKANMLKEKYCGC